MKGSDKRCTVRSLILTTLGAVALLPLPELNVRAQGTPSFILSWGSPGSGSGEFRWPSGIAIGRTGRVYVADNYLSRIQVFDNVGGYLGQWNLSGSGSAYGLAVDRDGNVYVTNAGARVQKLNSDGTLLPTLLPKARTQRPRPALTPDRHLDATG